MDLISDFRFFLDLISDFLSQISDFFCELNLISDHVPPPPPQIWVPIWKLIGCRNILCAYFRETQIFGFETCEKKIVFDGFTRLEI